MRLGGIGWLAANLSALASLFLSGAWPFTSKIRPSDCIDFGWMWISGRFAALGEPARIYDYAEFARAQTGLFGAGNCVLYTPFVYPPTLLFFTYPFGQLPFVMAFVLWNLILISLFLGAAWLIVRRVNAVIGAATLRPAGVDIYVGHNGFLTAGLMGLSLQNLERRPWLAGVFIALLTYKPQFGVLFPVALLASRNWRALASATGCGLAFVAAAALAFGGDTWLSFIASLLHRTANLSPDTAVQLRLVSVYGVLQSAGADARIAWAAQGCVALILAAAVWSAWSKPLPYAIRASILCTASLLASPYAITYDFCALAIAFAFLIADGLKRGFLAGERTAMLVCWIVLLGFAGVQLGPLAACAVLFLLLYRRTAAPDLRQLQSRQISTNFQV